MHSLLRESPLEVSRSIAAGLLQTGAVELRPDAPFTWSSGWKSPMYCDNRLVLGYPVLRNLVCSGFEAILKSDFPGVDIVAGAATGGIAHAAWLSERVGLPMVYVRSSAKGHGKGKQVEGRYMGGQTAVVIEDTLSTGSSAYQAAEALQEVGVRVLAVLSIYSYDFEVVGDRARRAGLPAYRLLDFATLVEVAREEGRITDAQVALLEEWRRSPDTWGK